MAPLTTEQTMRERFPDLKYRPTTSVANSQHFNYPGFHPSTTILQKGHIKAPGRKPFPNDAIFERDATVLMRDGIKIYADVFRPTNSTHCPDSGSSNTS